MALILIIDDEAFIRESLAERIRRLNHTPFAAGTLEEGFRLLAQEPVDLVFLDINLPDGNGLEAMSEIKQGPSEPEVIIITAVGSTEGAAMAIQNGAWDYVTKPFNADEIRLLTERTIEYRQAKQKQMMPVAIDSRNIIGKSRAVKACLEQVAQCAGSMADVLIQGETGTGKELFAKAIHDNHLTITGDYIVVDCSAMPDTLAESVLFGHVKGAFTGADKASDGLVRQADQGTLFLDEIGELPLELQKRFLRVLQERKFRPVGSSREIKSNFRLISATNRNLDEMVKQGKFRQDLLHRLKTVTITLPPLRERKEDIQILAQHYIHRFCKNMSIKTKALLPETLEVLEAYPWPGNVRELVNAIEKAIISEPGLPILYPMFLPKNIRIDVAQAKLKSNEESDPAGKSMPHPATPPLSQLFDDTTPLSSLKSFRETAVNEMESLYLKTLLVRCDWDLEKSADISGLSKSRLYYLIKKYDLKQK